MGISSSKADGGFDGALNPNANRQQAITGGPGSRKQPGSLKALPDNVQRTKPEDVPLVQAALGKLLLFSRIDATVQQKIVEQMHERKVLAGEILIKQGDTGIAANELYVVQSGAFEILETRLGATVRVHTKGPGDCFGEISLMFNSPRTATVAATVDSSVWVLDREVFRHYIREETETAASQVELFLNSVPLLSSLTRDEKLLLLDALEEAVFAPGVRVINQGDPGDLFYIIKEGEAVVYQSNAQGTRKVNHLFRADFFGEKALLSDEPRAASVEATTRLVCLMLKRQTFVEILGPLENIMAREKSPQVVAQRLMRLNVQGSQPHMPAEVLLKRRKRSRSGQESWEVVRARGHLDEVDELRKAGVGGAGNQPNGNSMLVLTEGAVLGGGAFSRVSIVTEETTKRQFALKRMRKSAVVQCPEHVFCEQAITRNTAHPFCIRQYASFQDKYHLYFLFDLMPGGDLMDVLVAEARAIRKRVSQGGLKRGCFAPKMKMLKGMDEDMAKFYIGSIVLALEYLHSNNIVYRDLKPENVFVDQQGFVKLGDFGFAKHLENGHRTYTFCGTPGYVAPENVLAHGYNYSVDWWGLGVLMFVLLTGRQPFSNPKTDDPMVVMRRIVDENWTIRYPPYLSPAAKDLISRLLERRPARRFGMLSGRAGDVKKHKWFEGVDWDMLAARKVDPARLPNDDSDKRLKELAEAERKGADKQPRETQEEMQECEMVFADF